MRPVMVVIVVVVARVMTAVAAMPIVIAVAAVIPIAVVRRNMSLRSIFSSAFVGYQSSTAGY